MGPRVLLDIAGDVFFLKDAPPDVLRNHDFGRTGDTLFTRNPYIAANFEAYGTPNAKAALIPLIQQVTASSAINANFDVPTPPGKAPWDFQRASLHYASRRTHTLIADDMGLGKSPMGVMYSNLIQARRNLLIIPSSIKRQWVTRIYEWSVETPTVYVINGQRSGVNPHSNWVICSYGDTDKELLAVMMAQDWDLMIFDEAHYLKTPNARRTRNILGHGHTPGLISRAARVLALTGTPLLNRPREAYTLARGLHWEAIEWQSQDKFEARYNPSSMISGIRKDGTPYQRLIEDTRNLPELQMRMRGNYMTRHLFRDVMPQVEYPEYELIWANETKPVTEALIAESLLDFDPDQIEAAPALTNDMKEMAARDAARKQMGIALAPQVADYIANICESGEKVVVVGHHHEVLDIILGKLHKYGAVPNDGRTPTGRRDKLREKFVSDPSCRVIVGNLKVLGEGVDGLQFASRTIIFAEADWVPSTNKQAVARLARPGQELRVQVGFFVAKGGISARILARAVEKEQTIHQTLDRRPT